MAKSIESANRERQGELGQFLTPEPVARFMASMFEALPPRIRLLDAGAGAAALTEALVQRVCQGNEHVQSIEVTAYEIDPAIQDALKATLNRCKLKCEEARVRFVATVRQTDFIEEVSALISDSLFRGQLDTFNLAIANPPYKKIGIESAVRKQMRGVGVETSNLYAAFVALIQRLLDSEGELVAITPRSFCNGPYFKPFRDDFLDNMELHRLHVFDSRTAAFSGDKVLQENVIFRAIKGRNQPREIIISNSSGKEGDKVTEQRVVFEEIIHTGDAGRFIHIPSASEHNSAKAAISGLTATLSSLGVTVSTGRVIDFRVKSSLRKDPEEGAVPLVYATHFNGGSIHWPKAGTKKPNAILCNDETMPWLVPSGTYLLTKRFTSKEEKRRLVACIFDPRTVDAKWLGFENHLNYFHSDGRGLDVTLARGLFAYLNSTIVDQYFRRFSGHTQVNATDLRALSYPSQSKLLDIGRSLKSLTATQAEIDETVSMIIHAE